MGFPPLLARTGGGCAGPAVRPGYCPVISIRRNEKPIPSSPNAFSGSESAGTSTRLLAPTIYGYDRQSIFGASSRVDVPALSDPEKAFGLDGMGFSFRLREMTGQ